jgi:hypothetical protein
MRWPREEQDRPKKRVGLASVPSGATLLTAGVTANEPSALWQRLDALQDPSHLTHRLFTARRLWNTALECTAAGASDALRRPHTIPASLESVPARGAVLRDSRCRFSGVSARPIGSPSVRPQSRHCMTRTN